MMVLAAILGWTSAGHAAERAEQSVPLDRSRFIGVEEITPGMRGTGRATFSSRGVEEFTVEVIGVLRGWVPGGNLIIIEAAGGPLAETGIFRGMSGSPIYLDGRLAGAVAYNLGGFGERPIAGVTPIAEMLPLFDPGRGTVPGPSPSTSSSSSSSSPSPAAPAAPTGSSTFGTPPLDGADASGAEDVQPIRTPVVLAGFAPPARAAMGSVLARYGLEVVSGGASGGAAGTAGSPPAPAAATAASGALVPGAPLGVQIVRGDVEATALGTVTHVDGGRILAFGHPMFLAGAVDLPMTSAEVFTVYPSQDISFVIGAAAQPVGRIVSDHMTGIAGRLGETSPMVPVSIRIRPATGAERTFHFEVVENRFFLAQFLGLLAFNSLAAEEKVVGDATLDVGLKVALQSGETLDFQDVVATTVPPNDLAAKVSAPLAGLLFNALEPVKVKRIDLDLGVTDDIRTAAIEEIMVDQDRVEPGQKLGITVFLRPYNAPRVSIPLTIEVPADVRPGPLLLRACAAQEATRWEAERAPRRFVPSTVEQLVELYEETGAHNQARVSLYADARGVVVDGREMQGLPGSVFDIMDTDRRAGGRSGSWGRLLHAEPVKTAYELSGCQELRLEAKAPQKPAQERRR
jgi:hypothetical protein